MQATAPGEAQAHLVRAVVHLQRGDHGAARADLDRAVALDPSPRTLLDRAKMVLALGDPEAAAEDARRALSLLPPDDPLEARAHALLREAQRPR